MSALSSGFAAALAARSAHGFVSEYSSGFDRRPATSSAPVLLDLISQML